MFSGVIHFRRKLALHIVSPVLLVTYLSQRVHQGPKCAHTTWKKAILSFGHFFLMTTLVTTIVAIFCGLVITLKFHFDYQSTEYCSVINYKWLGCGKQNVFTGLVKPIRKLIICWHYLWNFVRSHVIYSFMFNFTRTKCRQLCSTEVSVRMY